MAADPKRKRSAPQAFDGDCIDASDFDAIRAEMKTYDEQREIIIKRSRDVQKLSKQAIFSLHRGNDDEAAKRLAGAEAAAAELLPLIEATPALRGGSFAAACEEYAEAVILRVYLREGRLATRAEVKLAAAEEYLGGVLDFTGELNRFAVARATARDTDAVRRARDLVEALQGQFLAMDLRNGQLRKKYDALKYCLKRLEQTLYELSLTEHGLPTKLEDGADVDVGPAAAAAGGDEDL